MKNNCNYAKIEILPPKNALDVHYKQRGQRGFICTMHMNILLFLVFPQLYIYIFSLDLRFIFEITKG